MNSIGKWIIFYDFKEPPRQSFYSFLDELINSGGLKLVQQSVYIAKSPDDAQDLVALVEDYGGADVRAIPIGEGVLDQQADRQAARARLAALRSARLHRRGRKPAIGKRRKR